MMPACSAVDEGWCRQASAGSAGGVAMLNIENLEIHVSHACNLTCEGCSHYSNQGHKGMLSLEEAERWMLLWNRRLRPAILSLLGGEPTLHPRLTEFVILSRRLWPASHLRLVTNGFLLHRHPE